MEPVAVEEADERWCVEAAEAAEKVPVSGQSAEGGAGRGGAGEVGGSGSRWKISARRWSGMSVRCNAIFLLLVAMGLVWGESSAGNNGLTFRAQQTPNIKFKLES